MKAAHDKKEKWAGINVFTGKVMDAWKRGVIEPLKIKTQAVSSASEVAIMILRIDDVIATSPSSKNPPAGMPQGMPQGMGEY
jgi:chaperonin GroEL (HSP60 family)